MLTDSNGNTSLYILNIEIIKNHSPIFKCILLEIKMPAIFFVCLAVLY